MKKTYSWRIILTLTGALLIGVAYVLNSYSNRTLETISTPLFLFSLATFVTSFFLFFVNDKIFLKWLYFAMGWIILSIFLIAATPERHSFFPLGPSKEMVSIWLASLFVILSLGKIAWDWKKEKSLR